MGQSSSQHDKHQVGDMHTHFLDLVHFLSFLPSFSHTVNHPGEFTHSLFYLLYLHVTVPEPVSIAILVCVAGYLGRWTEEAGCQARGILKRRVFRLVRNFTLGERIVGN